MTDNQNGYGAQYGIDRHKVALTLFVNHAAKTAEQVEWTLPHMADVIVAENRAEKRKLPWFKLAIFGTVRTAKGSLRHDANVLKITGVENEHDSGRLSFDGAVALLREAGVRCVVYTSPSHLVLDNGVAVEKWRVMAPTSQPLDPAIRYQLAARINGVIKGVSTAESFTLSQSFYYGSVQKNPEHWAEVIDGEFIDLCDDLDAGAIGVPERGKKGKKGKPTAPAGPADASPAYQESDLDRLVATANDVDPNGDRQWHVNLRAVVASMVSKLRSDEEIHDRCAPACRDGWGDGDVQKLIDTAREKWGLADPTTGASEFEGLLHAFAAEVAAAGVVPLRGRPRGKPVIRYGALDAMVDQAARALLVAEVPFYQRGGALVRPVVLEVQTFDGEPAFAAQLVAVTSHYLRDALSRCSEWVKYSKVEKKWLPTNPPVEVALTLLDKFGDWDFPVLAGIITTQTLRPDGSVLSTPGYDPATQLLLINPPAMPDIPEQPTRADAEAALALLKGVLHEFPFVFEDEDADKSLSRAVALSAQISTVCRGAYPVVPMHVVDAPTAGSGKSYLLSTVSWIATGQAMPVMTAGKTEEETGKRLAAAAITGQQLICIDNVEGELGGDVLCQMIEQTRLKFRPLGVSNIVEIDTRSMCMFANGNNIISVGDVYRREIRCRLDSGEERPELRQFEADPKALILADRGRFVAACLTIARAYAVAGRPDRCKQIASFNGWSDTVRSALVWLGEADCVESMDNSKSEDPHTMALQTLLLEWKKAYGEGTSHRVALRDVVARCEDTIAGSDFGRTGAMHFTYGELRSAVQATNPEAHHHRVDVNAFGQWMRANRDKRIGGMCFIKRTSGHGDTTWYVDCTGKKGAKLAIVK